MLDEVEIVACGLVLLLEPPRASALCMCVARHGRVAKEKVPEPWRSRIIRINGDVKDLDVVRDVEPRRGHQQSGLLQLRPLCPTVASGVK